MEELFTNKMDIFNVLEVIESGYDCARSKRAKNTIERCVDRKGKTIRVVVVKSFSFSMNSDVWVITHVGMTSKKR